MKYGKYMISMVMSINKLNREAFGNLGDSIQEIMIDKIYHDIGIEESDCLYIGEENFELYNKENIIFLAPFQMRGFDKKILPLPDNFHPMFLSFVLFDDIFKKSPELIEYFKVYEPIGCRDEFTKNILKKYGIKAYLMGCFTVCFESRTIEPDNGKVFIIDIPEQANDYIPDNIKKDAVYLSNSVPHEVYSIPEEECIRQKNITIKRYEMYCREARLVITGRLHIAIPCLAMGIPVILIRDDYDTRFGWVDKYLPLYTTDDLKSIDWNPVSVDLSFARDKILSFIRKSLIGESNAEEELVELDNYYSNRKRTVLNKKIYKGVIEAANNIGHEDFTYAIWGAGIHGKYVHDIVSELYPQAKLVTIIDKYVEDDIFGVPIINGEKLNEIKFDHLFITTFTGKQEAIEKMKYLLGDKAYERYSLITTFVKT